MKKNKINVALSLKKFSSNTDCRIIKGGGNKTQDPIYTGWCETRDPSTGLTIDDDLMTLATPGEWPCDYSSNVDCVDETYACGSAGNGNYSSLARIGKMTIQK